MTNKSTKRALLSSVMALFLCFAMMVGTTFAWFTDSVASAGNIIKSGTLDVTMDWASGKEDPASANWTDASEGPIFNNDLWEPGYTEARHIKISNVGTLALNWTLAIVPNGEVSMLADVIDVYYYDGHGYGHAKQVADRSVAGMDYVGTLTEFLSTPIATGKLDANGSYSLTIVLKMREEAGNEYQDLSIGTDFAVQLLATQQAKEPDSFDATYDEMAGKTAVTPENAQAAIWAAKEGDVIYLQNGEYGTLVIENEDGSPKKGITIEHNTPANPALSTFNVDQIDLNGSENVVIRGIVFDIDNAQPFYKRDGSTNGYVVSIAGSGEGSNVGAKNVVIENCKFLTSSNNNPTYVAICFEEQGKPTSRATNITVKNCTLNKHAFNFIRANYLAEGTFTVVGNKIAGGMEHSALNFTGNAADLMIRDNIFGLESAFGGRVLYNGWNPEKAMLGTSRQGSNHINIEVTGNTFINNALVEGEGHVIELKSSYTTDNTSLVFEGNTFKGAIAEMTEETVPCIWH